MKKLNKNIEMYIIVGIIISIVLTILVSYQTLTKEFLFKRVNCARDPKDLKIEYELYDKQISNYEISTLHLLTNQKDTSQDLAIYIHGIGSTEGGKGELIPIAIQLKNRFDSYLIDMPSYCDSSGNKILLGKKASAVIKEIINQLKNKSESKNIILIGYSLGGYLLTDHNIYDSDYNYNLILLDPPNKLKYMLWYSSLSKNIDLLVNRNNNINVCILSLNPEKFDIRNSNVKVIKIEKIPSHVEIINLNNSQIIADEILKCFK